MFEVREREARPSDDDPEPGSRSQQNDIDAAPSGASDDEMLLHRHRTLMELLRYEAKRQAEERLQMQIDEDYYDHLQYRPEDARVMLDRGQAPLVFNESRQTIDWLSGTEKRMRKDYKILPREPNDEQGAELKTKLVKYTDDVNDTQWHRSKAFKQAATAGLSWLEEGTNRDPEAEIIYSGMEDWRNVYRDSHSRNVDYNVDARYLFRRRILDLDYACALLPDSKQHLMAMAGRHEDIEVGDDIWYMGEKLTGASETQWENSQSSFGARSAYMRQEGYFDNSRRRSVEILECWYRVPEVVQVFQGGPLSGRIFNPADVKHQEVKTAGGVGFYDAVKFRMRVMLATKDAPCKDMASPYRHGRFLMVPLWGYRRARDGQAYGVMRGMRDIQDDLNKRRSKALFALSVNRISMEHGAVDDIEELREEAARPDGIIVRHPNKKLTFEKNIADFQANLELAEQDSQLLRNAGGVTNENLGRETAAQSGKAIGLKQDQGSLTSSELFDNLLLAIKQAGKLRLSHIEQFWTETKAVRIVGDRKPIEWLEINQVDPATGEILNDVTAREADFIVDTQDYRSSLAQAAMEQLFDLLGKIATFAPQVVVSVLDLVVDTTEIQGREEWVSRIRKINGQRDPATPPTPEEMQAEQALQAKQAEQEQLATDTAKATLGKLQAEIDLVRANVGKLDVDGMLKKIDALMAALNTAQFAVSAAPVVAHAADAIATDAGLGAGAVPAPPQVPAELTQEQPTNPDVAPIALDQPAINQGVQDAPTF
jgi:hypothetical protein